MDVVVGTLSYFGVYRNDETGQFGGGLHFGAGGVTALGDLDGDTDVDADDLALFSECMAGPGNPNPGCDPDRFQRADLDCDGDVDAADFALLQNICTGPRN
jgi:hypothetical protein